MLLTPEIITKFSCRDLRLLDQLWVTNSENLFGFSLQKKIYLSVGGSLDGQFNPETWKSFASRVGWINEGQFRNLNELQFDRNLSKGQYPVGWTAMMDSWLRMALIVRTDQCRL